MWFLPSRGRPANIQRFFYLWKMTGCSTPGILWLDKDDAENYNNSLEDLPANWIRRIERRYNSLGDLQNGIFSYYPTEEWYGLMGDDTIPTSHQFDKPLIEQLPFGGLSYPDDGRWGEKLAGHPVIHGEMARALGWLALPGLKRTYIDNVLMEYARFKEKLKYVPESKVFHLHFSDGSAKMDKTYEKPGSQTDKGIFEKWLKQLYAA